MAAILPLQEPSQTVPEAEFKETRNKVWRRFRKHRIAPIGGVVLIVMGLVAIFANLIAPADPNFIDQAHWNGYPLAPGVAGHLLGTDESGRDLLSRLIFGARISLTVALVSVFLEISIGTVLGAVAGYYGGWVDFVIMRFTDVVLSIPLLPLLLVLTAIVAATSNKASLNFLSIVLIIGLLSWPSVARIVRAQFLSLREREFAEAARALGNPDIRIIFRHLLPNAVAPIIVQATLEIANIIILESTLSFLGFGIQPPTASWGNMLVNASSNMTIAPWVAIFPGCASSSRFWPSIIWATAFAMRSTPTCVNALIRGCAGILLALIVCRTGAASELQQLPTSYPLCTAASLAGFPWLHRAFGRSLPGIALRNMSLSTCRVAGYPALRAFQTSGQPAHLEFMRTPFIDQRIYAYSVTPGAAVFFTLYGHPPHGEFDRSCVGIGQLDIVLPGDVHAIDVVVSTGTCGGRMSFSQFFPVGELQP